MILSEDDGYAIISRKLFLDSAGEWSSRDGRVEEIVNWRNNTLSSRSLQLTTISALSMMVRDICLAHLIVLDEKSLGGVKADDALINKGYEVCQEWFREMFAAFDQLREARHDTQQLPLYRETLQPYSFLFKPAGQIALFRAARRASDLLGSAFSIREFMQKAAKIDWSTEGAIWQNIILVGGARLRVMAKQSNYEDAANMIVWSIYGSGDQLPGVFVEQLHRRWAEVNGASMPAAL